MLVRINDVDSLKENNIPFKVSTLYNWHHKRIVPFFVKIGKQVFIDTEEWEKYVQKCKEPMLNIVRKK